LKQKAHLLTDKNLFICENITFFYNSISIVYILGAIPPVPNDSVLAGGVPNSQQFISIHGG